MKSETSNYYHTEGIILKRQAYKENSLLCRCLTRDFGLISMIATGVYKEKSGFTGLLEPFTHIQLDLYRTQKTQIYTVRTAQLQEKVRARYDYRETLLINAAGELLLQCDFAIGEGEDCFDLLAEYLRYLARTGYHPFLVFVRFVNRLLMLLGIPLEASCLKCLKPGFHYFYPQEDGFLCSGCYRPVLAGNLIKLQEATAGLIGNIYNLGEIDSEKITKETVEEIRQILLIHLANHYNKPFHLKSLNDYR